MKTNYFVKNNPEGEDGKKEKGDCGFRSGFSFAIAGNPPDVIVGSIFFSQCAENVSQTGELCGRIKHKVRTSSFCNFFAN
uniref:hypothetical protein n=1 Tax=Candidatus Fimenecus sp. TaxID=3022888 RepID=UPI004024F10A